MARIGAETSEYRAVCVFSVDEYSPPCSAPAVEHLAVEDGAHGLVGLATCTVHLPIARAAGRVLGTHPHGLYCGLPGTRWADAGCELDDSGQRVDQAMRLDEATS